MTFLISDIALIKLPDGRSWDPEVFDIIEISKKKPRVLMGKTFTASGWGYTEDNPAQLAVDLEMVQMQFVDPRTVPIIGNWINAERVLAAAQVGRKSTCTGDIGGNKIFSDTTNYKE